MAVGLKEIIELPAQAIEERLGLGPEDGVAQLFIGAVTKGMFGGGFLYTNKDSISLGLVVSVQAMLDKQPPVEIHTLLDAFKERPEIAPLVAGGTVAEYSAHLIPEGGFDCIPRLVGDGVLVTGDAAGLALNMGVTVSGMDFALASGAMAARAIMAAAKRGDFSAAGLAEYERLLRGSFVLKYMQTFRHMPSLLQNPRLFTTYPEAMVEMMESVFLFDGQPKRRLSATVLSHLQRRFANLGTLRDLWDVGRV